MSDIDCARTEELLSDVLEGTLDQVLRAEVETHLAGCFACHELQQGLADVVASLHRMQREPAPSLDLAVRAARAGLAAARAAVPIAPVKLPPWVLALAAAIALATTAGLVGLTNNRPSGSIVERAANASVYLTEKRDSVVEDLHLLRVVIATMFEGRLDRVNDLVDDYRRRQQKRQPAPAPQKIENILEGGLVKRCEQPRSDAAAHDAPAYLTHPRGPQFAWPPHPRQGDSA